MSPQTGPWEARQTHGTLCQISLTLIPFVIPRSKMALIIFLFYIILLGNNYKSERTDEDGGVATLSQ